MKWQPIADLPDDLSRFRDRELEALFHAWTEQRKVLPQEQALQRFNLELKREWAIETGAIEGLYTLDRGTTQTLIERGIESSYIRHDATNRDPEWVARMVQAQAEVLEGLFAFIKSEGPLSTSYIKELHAAMLRHQDKVVVSDQFGNLFEKNLLKGAYKTQPNNPSREDGSVHEYCPPEHVDSEMDRLIALHAEHVQRDLRPEVQAAWLHHAFTQIHPFEDGNGRVARTIATLIFVKAGYFPLTIRRGEEYGRYIGAMESADAGDLHPVVRIFGEVQKRLLTQGIVLAFETRPAANVTEAIGAVRDLLVNLGRIDPKEWLKARELTTGLVNTAFLKLKSIEAQLKEEISRVDRRFSFTVGELEVRPPKSYEVLQQQLKRDPDFSQHHASRVLGFNGPFGSATIVVTFHDFGQAFRGLLAASAYFQSGENEPVPLSDDIFRISYEEPQAEITQRFNQWLEACLVRGIELWRRTLV